MALGGEGAKCMYSSLASEGHAVTDSIEYSCYSRDK